MDLSVVRWAAEECERQRSGEMSVYRMLTAWEIVTANWSKIPITVGHIIAIGKIIEPEKNANGFRNMPVLVNGNPVVTASLIPSAIASIVQTQPRIGGFEFAANYEGPVRLADRWYQDFEEIHPFLDGNGRTGSILWNWLMGTLENPVAPPDYWSN